MKKVKIAVSAAAAPHEYEIQIGANILPGLGDFTRGGCAGTMAKRICIVSNRKVFGLYGETAKHSLEKAGFLVSVFLMPDGERYKSWRVLEKVLSFFSEQKLARSDVVVALGGGVTGDLAGFAAAIFQRGLPFIQVPTTFLAQIDSSVGGKTAVNTSFGKNLIGAFYQPRGVLVDVVALRTLPQREMRAGLYEAIKHAAIADRTLFEQTQKFLQKFPPANLKLNFENADFLFELQDLIAANINIKAEIVMGDERENLARVDARSRRILNFGHTVGHALETITLYKRFKHGEAVGIGMLAAAEISQRIGKISEHELNLLSDVIGEVGKLPRADDIAPETIIKAFSHDKKAVGGSFKWILLEKIGQTAILDNKHIPKEVVRTALCAALKIQS